MTVWIPEGLWGACLGRKGRTRESLQAQVVEGLRLVTGWEGASDGTEAKGAPVAGAGPREADHDDAVRGEQPRAAIGLPGPGSEIRDRSGHGGDERDGAILEGAVAVTTPTSTGHAGDDAGAAGAAGPGGMTDGDF